MQFHSGNHKDDKVAEQEAEQVNKYLSLAGMGLCGLVKTPGNKTYPTHHRLGGAPRRTRKTWQIAEIYQHNEMRQLSQDLNFKLGLTTTNKEEDLRDLSEDLSEAEADLLSSNEAMINEAQGFGVVGLWRPSSSMCVQEELDEHHYEAEDKDTGEVTVKKGGFPEDIRLKRAKHAVESSKVSQEKRITA
ncbi:MAG: hypothetical protein Q9226_001840 [Calogaya cf. arnoldii]